MTNPLIHVQHCRGPGRLDRAYAHNCDGVDGVFIDETCAEFLSCTCYDSLPGVLALKDAVAVALDSKREPRQ